MPKMKSHSGAKKRFKLTATGRLKHKQANLSHLLTGKRHKNKRNARGTAIVNPAQEKQLKKIIPYA